MGEFILKKMLADNNLSGVEVISRGVSDEESGNDIYPDAARTLRAHSIPFTRHTAKRISDSDFASSDIIYALDCGNYHALVRRFSSSEKIHMLCEKEVEDPWYTGNFEKVYREIAEACRNIVEKLKR